jgi:hypothetical protein
MRLHLTTQLGDFRKCELIERPHGAAQGFVCRKTAFHQTRAQIVDCIGIQRLHHGKRDVAFHAESFERIKKLVARIGRFP